MDPIAKENILSDLLSGRLDKFSCLYDANNTTVLEHNKYPNLIIKISNKDISSAEIQSKILQTLPSGSNNIGRILDVQTLQLDNKEKTVELIVKMKGYSKQAYTDSDILNVIKQTKILHESINQKRHEYIEQLPPLDMLFSNIINNSPSESLRKIAAEIQNDKAYEQFLDRENQTIIIADMVYENILFDKESVSFIDLDPLIQGPKNLQLSILLTSNILVQQEIFDHLSVELIQQYFQVWEKDRMTRVDLIALTIFPLLILAMKQVNIDELDPKTNSLYYKLKTVLFMIMRQLNNDNEKQL